MNGINYYQAVAVVSGLLCAVVSVALQIMLRFFSRSGKSKPISEGEEAERREALARGGQECAVSALAFLFLGWFIGAGEGDFSSGAEMIAVISLLYVIMFLFWTVQDKTKGRVRLKASAADQSASEIKEKNLYTSMKWFCLFYGLTGILLAFLLH